MGAPAAFFEVISNNPDRIHDFYTQRCLEWHGRILRASRFG
jgi:hypothetical protein